VLRAGCTLTFTRFESAVRLCQARSRPGSTFVELVQYTANRSPRRFAVIRRTVQRPRELREHQCTPLAAAVSGRGARTTSISSTIILADPGRAVGATSSAEKPPRLFAPVTAPVIVRTSR